MTYSAHGEEANGNHSLIDARLGKKALEIVDDTEEKEQEDADRIVGSGRLCKCRETGI